MTAENIQDLMDAGLSIRKIAEKFKVHHSKISRIIARFNLEWYIAFDEFHTEHPKLWNFDEDYRISKCEFGYLSKYECMQDVISKFVSDHEPDEITSQLLKKHRIVESYIYCLFDNLQAFYDYYKLDGMYISYSRQSKLGTYSRLGHEFERLVERALKDSGVYFDRHPTIEDCRPDFVSGEVWYDAKLSRSTVLNRGCETIEKYRKHTDYLTIIYGIDDTVAADPRATFVHISQYKQFVSVTLQREIDAFIRKANMIKIGDVAICK
ncbi:hypothetical protein ACIQXW_23385 [Lysinibacillus sp. NPDC097162]|uniref:hypothetical protein n=1 Tax=Lysinibacillus sp. NPDC097162 TaxID=3364140 RepID=UPI00380567C8